MEILHDFKKERVWGIAVDSEDSIFVSNGGNYSIDKVSLKKGKVSITQSTNIPSSPLALAINSKNEIYIATNKGEIMKMTKEGIISNIAGDGTYGFADGIGKNARIGDVFGLCFDENDIAYFCDYSNSHSAIRKVTPEGKVTTICGGEKGNSDGKGEHAKFNGPSGIVYNSSTKLFYITDFWNKSIRKMTVDGNVDTLCKYSDYLWAITIDGEGKLYVSTRKDHSVEGEIITVDTKGEIKHMKNTSVKNCSGVAFNSKGDLFFISDPKLCVIRDVDTKAIQTLKKELTTKQTEIQELKKQLATAKAQLDGSETRENQLLQWLSSIQLTNLLPILQNIGAKNLEFVKLIEERHLKDLNIKLLEKEMLLQSIKKLKEGSATRAMSIGDTSYVYLHLE